MKYDFKTSINCGGCVKSVTPALNKVEGITSWKVDTENPLKILSVESENVNKDTIINAVKSAGFDIEEYVG